MRNLLLFVALLDLAGAAINFWFYWKWRKPLVFALCLWCLGLAFVAFWFR